MSSSSGGREAARQRWLVSYADMLTLLFCLFLTLFSMSQMQVRMLQQELQSFRTAALAPPRPEPELVAARPAAPPSPVMPSGWKVEVDGEELRLSLASDEILFDSGSAQLSSQGRLALDDLKGVVADTNLELRVEGHTDDVPLRGSVYADNWELSVARAVAVVCYLMQRYQLPAQRVTAMGYGSDQPIASNATEAGRRLNRRVVLVVRRKVSSSSPLVRVQASR